MGNDAKLQPSVGVRWHCLQEEGQRRWAPPEQTALYGQAPGPGLTDQEQGDGKLRRRPYAVSIPEGLEAKEGENSAYLRLRKSIEELVELLEIEESLTW